MYDEWGGKLVLEEGEGKLGLKGWEGRGGSARVMLSEGLNGEINHYRKRELHELIGTI